ACQSVGATCKGKAAGTFGHMGCFSFDPVKTITCGEGGAVVTNDAKLYARADQFSDHGHDHVGSDRGKEGHPIVGTNFRISELNAAVGLAQLRKLDNILETQRKNKAYLKNVLGEVPGISFRRLIDPEGDSATFLSFMLPDEDSARKAAGDLAAAGVDGCFYWFDNNWHYIRQWDHLKNLAAAARLPLQLLDDVPDYGKVSLPASDTIMGRTICMQIKLSWTRKGLEDRAARIKSVFGL
ncbi:MAG: DegT/DnrJ/EryC1/StrS family aminotransferase, partial [Deltaproteobacteria bacterium]|nr:DegT/DnrJ/EryC1/StrS family aminotransferase [Deltaproteobacteria bacterium]